MILWWGKKKQPDPKTGDIPIEPLKQGEKAVSPLDKPVASLDEQLFGNAPVQVEPEGASQALVLRLGVCWMEPWQRVPLLLCRAQPMAAAHHRRGSSFYRL